MGAAEKHEGWELARRDGRDEMNLAEFPITLLTDRAPKSQKTLIFRDGDQTLTITSSDAYGLPTAADADVIIGLIHLTKQANNFTNPTVSFTRYNLIHLLGWPLKGDSYQRLTQSLKCWTGVTLNYEQAWWDNRAKRKVDATFHILESVVIAESSSADDEAKMASSFTWNKRFFESCRADNLKRLDLNTYFSLRSSVSKRMYRFLDKRFYHKPSWTFDLQEFAHEHVGLGRNYADNGKLKEKLGPAIKELEDIGYLEPMSREERYKQVRRGQWTITLTRKAQAAKLKEPSAVEEPDESQAVSRLEKELSARGVTASKARSIVKGYPAERIERQMEQVDFIRENHPGIIKSLGGFLWSAIKEDFAPPPGFVSRAERARRAEAARDKERADAEQTRRRLEAEAREQAAQAKVAAYLESLSMAELERLDREILSEPETERVYERQFRGFKRVYLECLRKEHVRKLLGLGVQA